MNTRDDDKSRVQQATDLVRLIGEQVALRARGKEFVGLCPFHDDSKPSMYVSPAKQIYKCFACGAGGDAFSFAMNYHKMTFPEALAHLAQRAGIELTPRGGRSDPAEASDRSRLAEANARALAFFRARLSDGDAGRVARDYLDRRGVSAGMIEAFALGYAPDGWDALASHAARTGWDVRSLEMAGLVSPRRSGQGLYDRLRHRLVFPIFDAIGRPIAFGGRKLREADEPKYLNSPETPLFNKSATLYGLHLAKKPMIGSRTAVIVEGYTDVIACHQAGEANAVATLGTALTPDHVRELRRYVDRVVLVFDADEAGHKAADRAVEVFLTGELDVSIAVLPEGVDPADLLAQEDGPERWRAALAAAQPALAYLFETLRWDLQNANGVTSRERLIDAVFEKLTLMGIGKLSVLKRALVIDEIASVVRLNKGTVNKRLIAHMSRVKEKHAAPRSRVPSDVASPKVDPMRIEGRAEGIAKQIVIGCILQQPDLFFDKNVDEEVPPTDFMGPERELYEVIYNKFQNNEVVTTATVLATLAESNQLDLANLASSYVMHAQLLEERTSFDVEGLLQSYLDALRYYRLKRAYDKEKAKFMEVYEADSESTEYIDRFLIMVSQYFSQNPYAGRIYRGEDISQEQVKAMSFKIHEMAEKAVAG